MKSKVLISIILLSWGCFLSSSAMNEPRVYDVAMSNEIVDAIVNVADSTEQAPVVQDTIKENVQKEKGEICQTPERLPEYPGGMKAMMEYLNKNIRYPKQCQKKGITGRVIAQFVINTDGSISDVEVIKKVHPLLDQEAVRVIQEMPKWQPGMQKGKNVRVRFTLPVNFNLKK
ncbi:MAG: energy transducer TonB [Bacteroidaceae bacterium]|nr:energy transducer TonB [Bacteroidaceae bacterium]